MNSPRPALVTQRGARRLPRVPLLLLCAAYLLPGLFGRDPWRSADLAAFGQMVAIAEGRSPWWAPQLGGVAADAAWLPHWLGAAFIAVTSPWLSPEFAARLPFAALLALTMALVWYTSFHLARTDAAQPVAFAFGGEAAPVDYARAIADGALLALLATLGLLQLGHETTPELAQLAAIALFVYALAAAPFRGWQARAAVLASLPLLAGSGAPTVALLVGLAGLVACGFSRIATVRRFVPWVAAAVLAGVLTGWYLGTWQWRVQPPGVWDAPGIARQWLWFLWPTWPLALWTLWRWRRQLSHRHISVPLLALAAALLANLAMGGSDRALLLGLPAAAVLASFALPTLKRSASAAIDWFSMFFFTGAALFVWLMFIAMHTGTPARPAANIAKLAEGFEPRFSLLALLLAAAGTLAWAWLLRWRTGRHREALWKSLVLPAGGVALVWLLVMTLWLPLLDYARSPRAWAERVTATLGPPNAGCVAAPGLAPAAVAALEYFGRYTVDARADAASHALPAGCQRLLLVVRGRVAPPPPPGWALAGEVQRPTERNELTLLYTRAR